MKTWICDIFGGGTPLYLVSAEDEKSAWTLIKNEFSKSYPHCFLCKKMPERMYCSTPIECSGLIDFSG